MCPKNTIIIHGTTHNTGQLMGRLGKQQILPLPHPPRSSQPFRRSEVFSFPIRLLLFRPLPWCDIPITGRSGIGPPQSRGNGAPGRFGVSDENCFQIFLSPATLCHGVVWMAGERVELHNYLIIFGPGLWLLFSVSINTPPVIIRAHANTQM